MKNLAGNEGCDEIIRKELEAAGIEIVDIFSPEGEVPSNIIGFLPGWSFRRAWYYWVATASDGVSLPFDAADRLHKDHGNDVRVSGHCGAPAPREWYNKPWFNGVPLYHVDTQDGLNALADAIRKVAGDDGIGWSALTSR